MSKIFEDPDDVAELVERARTRPDPASPRGWGYQAMVQVEPRPSVGLGVEALSLEERLVGRGEGGEAWSSPRRYGPHFCQSTL